MFVAGEFSVLGTFHITNRGLIAYGNVVLGEVRAGEALFIPLNGSVALSAVIKSVEAVHLSRSVSHVALLLSCDDDRERHLLETLNFAGETLKVGEPSLETTFDEACMRLRNLLLAIGWPATLSWVERSQILPFVKHLI